MHIFRDRNGNAIAGIAKTDAANRIHALEMLVKQGTDLLEVDLRNECLESADLRNAHMLGANLTGTKLCTTVLDYADFSYAKFDKADLRSASLWCTNLQNAQLTGAYVWDTLFYDTVALIGERPYCVVSNMGSCERSNTLWLTSSGPIVQTGCFRGTLDEFETKIQERHAEYSEHNADYLALLAFFKAHATIWTPKG